MFKYRVIAALVFLEFIILVFFYFHGAMKVADRQDETSAKRRLVRELMLTDLAVWTEARYTRHPSQADLFTPFQDFPSSIEHFPAGSIISPPGAVLNGWKSDMSDKPVADGKT